MSTSSRISSRVNISGGGRFGVNERSEIFSASSLLNNSEGVGTLQQQLNENQSELQKNCYQNVEELMNNLEENEEEDDTYGQYAWEQDVERSWDDIVDENGVLGFRDDKFQNAYKRHYISTYQQHYNDCGNEEENPNENVENNINGLINIGASQNRSFINQKKIVAKHFRKGMIRNMIILFDMTASMREMDFKPDRLNCSIKYVQEFMLEYFHQSPISQIGLIVLRNLFAETVTSLTANPYENIDGLNNAKKKICEGSPSLHSGIEKCINILSGLPPYGTREILIIFGSLRTCDLSSVEELIEDIKKHNVRINAISLAPEIYILNKVCKESGGKLMVAQNAEHLRDLLSFHSTPIPWIEGMQPSLVRMGFAAYKRTTVASLCICHEKLSYDGYFCSLCMSKICQIPYKCKCCGLNLVSPADISRTFHHIFPPSCFVTIPDASNSEKYVCCSCSTSFKFGGAKCPDCTSIFCFDCDVYIHEQLHQCPFCIANDIKKLTN